MGQIQYFLSYSRHDAEFVLRLTTNLKKAGANVWLDQMDIAAGSRWNDTVENALKASEGLIIVFSSASVKSQNVLDEVFYAIKQGKRIVPLIIEACTIPFRLSRFQYIDFTDDFDSPFQHLLATLQNEQHSDYKLQLAENPVSIQTGLSHTDADERNSLKPTRTSLTKLAGILFIILAVIIAICIHCFQKVQNN